MFPCAIDNQPVVYLERNGNIFARFGGDTQSSGNISYGVEVDGQRFFIKTAGDPADTAPYFDFDGRERLLRNAARLAEMIHHPLLPAFQGLIESPGGPILVYDWRDGAHLGSSTTAFQRFRSLPAEEILVALDELFDLHGKLDAAGWVPGDFYNGSLLYDFERRQLTVIDLDSYLPGPYRNDMGRMFGSDRFMAPEEFSHGAPIDGRTTAYVMARTVLVFLADGILNRDAFRATDGVYAVVQEAVTTRFPNYGAFHRMWLAARGEARGVGTQIGTAAVPTGDGFTDA
jgi:serine/threonine protein kinase